MSELDRQVSALNVMNELLMRGLTGMSLAKFERTANLMRKPEGLEGEQVCPVCKQPIHANEDGDVWCQNWSPNYEQSGGCYWHRYADGTNYWSSPLEVIRAMPEEMQDHLKDLL